MAPQINYAQEPQRFFSDVLSIGDRDSELILPFKERFAQRRFSGEIQQARAFNVYKTALRAGAAPVLLSVLDTTRVSSAKEAIEKITTRGVDLVLERLRGAGFERQIQDGPIRFCVLKARRLGFSSAIAAWGLHRAAFVSDFKTCVIAHEGEAAANLLRITSTFYDFWDENKVSKPDLEGDSATQLAFSNRSFYQVKTAGAKDIRSFQFPFIHLSEFAFYERAAAIGAALMGAPKHAWIFVESTANGPGGPFYDRYQKSVPFAQIVEAFDMGKPLPEGTFIRHFCSWLDDPDYQIAMDTAQEREEIMATLDDYEQSLFTRFPEIMSPERIKWHRFIKSNANHDTLTPEQFMLQEFPASPEEAFQNSGDRPFDVTKQRARADFAAKEASYFRVRPKGDGIDIEPCLAGVVSGANLQISERPRKKKHYVVAIDCAKGLAQRDATVISVFDRGDGIRMRQVAESRSWLDQHSAALLAVTLAEWYNDAYMIWEINEATHFASVVADTCRYNNFYIRETFDAVVAQSKSAFRYGFLTNPSTKKMIIEGLRTAFREDLIYLCSVQGVKECDIFTRDERGHYGAPSGQHDDCVITYALAWFAFSTGKAPSLPTHTHAEIEKESKREDALANLDEQTVWWIKKMMERDAAADADDPIDDMTEEQILLKNPHAYAIQ
jgi:hypothetical protein